MMILAARDECFAPLTRSETNTPILRYLHFCVRLSRFCRVPKWVTCMRAVNRQPMFTARGTRRAFSFLCPDCSMDHHMVMDFHTAYYIIPAISFLFLFGRLHHNSKTNSESEEPRNSNHPQRIHIENAEFLSPRCKVNSLLNAHLDHSQTNFFWNA